MIRLKALCLIIFVTLGRVSLASSSLSPLEIRIQPVGGVPNHDDQELTLKATVFLKQSLQGDLHYKWRLPEGAEIVSGQIEDDWAQVTNGQAVSSKITIVGVSSGGTPKLIEFQVIGKLNGMLVGKVAVFTTQPQNMIMPQLKQE